MVAPAVDTAVIIVTGLGEVWRKVMESLVVMVTGVSGPSTTGAEDQDMMGNLGLSGASSGDRGGGFLRRSERIRRRLGLFSSSRVGEAPESSASTAASTSDEPQETRSRRRRGMSCFPRRSRNHSRTRSRSPLESRSSSPSVSTVSSSGYATSTPIPAEFSAQSTSSQSSSDSGRVRRTGARWAEFLARGSRRDSSSNSTAAASESSASNSNSASSTILNLSTLYPSGEFVTTTSNDSTSTVHVRVRAPIRESTQTATSSEDANPVPAGRFGYNLRSRARAQRAASTPPAGTSTRARSPPESSPDDAGLRLADLLSLRISVRPTDRDTSTSSAESTPTNSQETAGARPGDGAGSTGASTQDSRGDAATRTQGTRITIIRIRTAPSTPELGSREGAQPRIAVSTHNMNGPTPASSTSTRREDSTTEATGDSSPTSSPTSESRSPGAASTPGPIRERISVMEFDTNGDSDNESDSDILEMINSRLRQVAARTEGREEQEGAIRTRRTLSSNQASPLTLVFLGIVISADGEDTPRGLTKEQIDTLPTRTFSEPSREENANNSCNVCISEYSEGSVLRCLPCTHEFHAACVDRWLGINASCPVCRHTVTSDA